MVDIKAFDINQFQHMVAFGMSPTACICESSSPLVVGYLRGRAVTS